MAMTPRLIRGGHRRYGKSPCPEPRTAPCAIFCVSLVQEPPWAPDNKQGEAHELAGSCPRLLLAGSLPSCPLDQSQAEHGRVSFVY